MNRSAHSATTAGLVTSFISLAALALQSCTKQQAPPSPAPAPPVADAQPETPVVVKEATERLFQNPYDAEAVYFLSQKNGTPDALSVLIKRDSQQGVQYSRWLFNCPANSAQNLGVATNIQALDRAENSMPSKSQHYEAASRLGAIAKAVCPQ